MIFNATTIDGLYVIDVEKSEDERGFFARSFCVDEFEKHGLETAIRQCNISFNKKRGTLRGMHYQAVPMGESKLLRATAGAAYVVAIDLRNDSATYKKWFGIELTKDSRRMLYIPKYFAAGFQTLEDNTEIFYTMFADFSPEYAKTIRYNDKQFAIEWPLPVSVISEKDKEALDFKN